MLAVGRRSQQVAALGAAKAPSTSSSGAASPAVSAPSGHSPRENSRPCSRALNAAGRCLAGPRLQLLAGDEEPPGHSPAAWPPRQQHLASSCSAPALSAADRGLLRASGASLPVSPAAAEPLPRHRPGLQHLPLLQGHQLDPTSTTSSRTSTGSPTPGVLPSRALARSGSGASSVYVNSPASRSAEEALRTDFPTAATPLGFGLPLTGTGLAAPACPSPARGSPLPPLKLKGAYASAQAQLAKEREERGGRQEPPREPEEQRQARLRSAARARMSACFEDLISFMELQGLPGAYALAFAANGVEELSQLLTMEEEALNSVVERCDMDAVDEILLREALRKARPAR